MPESLFDVAARASRECKLFVLKLRREPTPAEAQLASILVVNGQVVKNRVGRLGPWDEVRKDFGGTPMEVVDLEVGRYPT
jgi:hypothetical protein